MANNLKIYGIINRVLKQRSGTTQDGRQWWAQDFVLEVQDGNFVQIVKFTISGKSLTQENVQHIVVGNRVTVHFSLASKEVTLNDGRTFYNTNASAWKVEAGDTTSNTAIPRANVAGFEPCFAASGDGESTVAPAPTVQPATTQQEEDLPF